MKQAFRLLCAIAVLAFFWLSYTSVKAQTTPNATPDGFVTQITSSTQDSFAGDMSGDGRFVVIESTGDISTEKTDARNNADGNREIFLFDYAQRRIFQITDTKSFLKTNPSPTPTPSPTATPSPSASPTPTPVPSVDPNTIQVEVSNHRPIITNDGKVIVFMSNAATPGNFDGNTAANSAALSADGNQEIWTYRIPDVTAADLTTGADLGLENLANGTFTRVTDTPASAPPTAGTGTTSPTVAFDNRDPAVNDNGSILSFVSNRNLTGGNADGGPEVYLANVSGTGISFVQATNTPLFGKPNIGTFTENPSLSGDGTVLAFISNANIPQTGGATNNSDFNSEVYVLRFNGTSITSVKQVTNTTNPTGDTNAVTVLSPGRRLSRNGNFLALESRADLSGNSAVQAGGTVYLYDVNANTFKQVGPRPTTAVLEGGRFPTFTGDSLTLVFSSVLNFKTDGTVPTTATDGLNPNGRVQLFAVAVPAANFFTRLTDTPAPIASVVPQIQAYPSNTVRRIAFTTREIEFGGGNADLSFEAFYLLVPPATSDVAASSNAIAFTTGASDRIVINPSPAPSASPSPPDVTGLAPGMIGIARPAPSPAPSVVLAPASINACTSSSSQCASEAKRRPPLPVELGGVSVSVGGGAAGLYFVSPGQINFVVPPGLAPSTTIYPVVINNNGAVVRSQLLLPFAVPDIATTTMGPLGRAIVFNVTNPNVLLATEPFSVTSKDQTGATVPTVLKLMLTGVRLTTTSTVTVRIGTTDITGASILFVGPTDTPGVDEINFTLPATLAAAGDVPIIVTISSSGTFTSRPADSAPHITIQ